LINNKKIVVVLPAYNAEKTLARTVHEIPNGFVDEIVLVDDGSQDSTVEIAKSLNRHFPDNLHLVANVAASLYGRKEFSPIGDATASI
jgi:glycosyltransferase involved in cell wall biosynthesis